MRKEYLTTNPEETKKIGREIAKKIIRSPLKEKAIVVAMEGELGGGKTTLLQGFGKELGIKERMTSPTFVILKKFQLDNLAVKQFNNFYHIDCYRIQNIGELIDLNLEKIISNPRNIVAIEWADRIKKIIPKSALWLKFEFIDKRKRRIIIN